MEGEEDETGVSVRLFRIGVRCARIRRACPYRPAPTSFVGNAAIVRAAS